MVQKLVSKVTYHFVEGHLSRKQTVNGIRSRRLCAQEAALFLNENAMEIKFNLVSENSHVKSIKPIPFVFFERANKWEFFPKALCFELTAMPSSINNTIYIFYIWRLITSRYETIYSHPFHTSL